MRRFGVLLASAISAGLIGTFSFATFQYFNDLKWHAAGIAVPAMNALPSNVLENKPALDRYSERRMQANEAYKQLLILDTIQNGLPLLIIGLSAGVVGVIAISRRAKSQAIGSEQNQQVPIRKAWWFFEPPQGNVDKAALWLWWEKRRLMYNGIVILTCFCSLFAFMFFCTTSGMLSEGEDAEEPIGLLLAAVLGPILWNIAYCLGPICDIWLNSTKPDKRFGPTLLKLGVAFSVLICSAPALIWCFHWTVQAFNGFPKTY